MTNAFALAVLPGFPGIARAREPIPVGAARVFL